MTAPSANIRFRRVAWPLAAAAALVAVFSPRPTPSDISPGERTSASRHLISEMKDGEEGFAVSWAAQVADTGQVRLDTGYSVTPQPDSADAVLVRDLPGSGFALEGDPLSFQPTFQARPGTVPAAVVVDSVQVSTLPPHLRPGISVQSLPSADGSVAAPSAFTVPWSVQVTRTGRVAIDRGTMLDRDGDRATEVEITRRDGRLQVVIPADKLCRLDVVDSIRPESEPVAKIVVGEQTFSRIPASMVPSSAAQEVCP
jgi:hypothetical protein